MSILSEIDHTTHQYAVYGDYFLGLDNLKNQL